MNLRSKSPICLLATLCVLVFILSYVSIFAPETGSPRGNPIKEIRRLAPDDSLEAILNSISINDLIAMVFWEKNDALDLDNEILKEKSDGLRDKYFLPNSYLINDNTTHFDDTGFTGQYQKEVYMMARTLLRKMSLSKSYKSGGRKLITIDVGCGSGWKLVKYLSEEFHTIGIETEPALSFLRKTYPEQVWINSGKEDETLPEDSNYGTCDVGISADVVEHIRDPNELLTFLRHLKCEVYVISTPKRERTNRSGPPTGGFHVREWTFNEFRLYLQSQGFEVLKSYDGVQNPTTQMHVVKIAS